MTMVKMTRIVPLCRLPKSGNIIKKEFELFQIIQSSISWTEDSLNTGKIWYHNFNNSIKVKISRCKVIEIAYVPERTSNSQVYVADGVIIGSRDLEVDDLNKIYKRYGKKYKDTDALYYTGFDCDTVITDEAKKLYRFYLSIEH